MQANWPECITFTLSFEGGYDANPKDRGNWTSGVIGKGALKGTKYGIAAHVYPGVDIKNLTRDQAVLIYQTDYWPKVAGDRQPSGVDLIAWDICVNSGASRALSIEAKALGSAVKTATGLAAVAQASPDKVALVKSMCAHRAAFYRGLSTFSTFGKGWLRRNAAVEAKGVTLALKATSATPDEIKKRLGAEAANAGNVSKANATAAAGTSVGAGSQVPTSTATQIDWSLGWKVVGVVILLIVAGLFVRKFIQHRERQNAYAEAAKGV